MNSDVRHNSCSAQQRLWMSHAPDDGERVQPKGFTSIATLEAHAAKISANEAEELQLRLPMAMQEAGWIVLPGRHLLFAPPRLRLPRKVGRGAGGGAQAGGGNRRAAALDQLRKRPRRRRQRAKARRARARRSRRQGAAAKAPQVRR